MKNSFVFSLIFIISLSVNAPVFAGDLETNLDQDDVTLELGNEMTSIEIPSENVTESAPVDATSSTENISEMIDDTSSTMINEEVEFSSSVTEPEIAPIESLESSERNDLENSETIQAMSVSSEILKNPEEFQAEGTKFNLETDISSGALTMQYPFEIPPGRNGMQPSLALNYNSQNTKDGIFGYGWDINIPYIERINKDGVDNLYEENYFNSSFDGELANTALFENPYGFYTAKVENNHFIKYEYQYGDYWEVQDENGLTYIFGNSFESRQSDLSNSSHTYKWMLEEIRDQNDNFIKYTYTKDSGQIYPVQIKYTGNGTSNGQSTITFSKEFRPDEQISAEAGFLVKTRFRINKMSINNTGESNIAKKYFFNYTLGDNGYRSMLEKIQHQTSEYLPQFGSSIEYAMPDDEFEYELNEEDWIFNTSQDSNLIPVNLCNKINEYSGARIVDVNGDAFPDIIFAKKGSTKKVFINNGDNTGWTLDPNYNVPYYFVDKYGEDLGVRIADVNGDGLPDLLRRTYHDYDKQVYINKGDGTGWEWDASYDIPFRFLDGEYNEPQGVRIGDVNGDGLPDLVQSHKATYLNKADGTGWESSDTFNSPVKFTDPGTFLFDVNGDGLDDIVQSQEDYADEVYINTGEDWDYDPNYNIPVYFAEENGNDNGVRIADANGDGLLDLFYARDDDWNNRAVYINKGNGTGWEKDTQYNIPKPFITDSGYEDNGVRLADFNGDGLVDILYRNGNSDSNNKIYRHIGKNPDLLQYFDNRYGGRAQINYLPSTQYKNSNQNANLNLPFVLNTVKSIFWFSDMNNEPTTTSYEYSGGEYYYNNELERRFAGFNLIKATDKQDYVTKTYFHQGNDSDSSNGENIDAFYKIGNAYAIEKYDDNNKLYSKDFVRYTDKLYGNRFLVKPSQEVKIIYDGNSTKRSKGIKYTYDNANGNLEKKTVMGEVNASDNGDIYNDLGTDIYTVEYKYTNPPSNSMMSLIAMESYKDASSNLLKERKYYYDNLGSYSASKGNLTEIQDWVSGTKYISNKKKYNNYGLVIEETDPLGNKTFYQYDSYNLYPKTITNALNQYEQFSYDYSSGKIKEYTDFNNMKYEYIYDSFDRIYQKKQPDPSNPNTLIVSSQYKYKDSQFPRYYSVQNKINDAYGPFNYYYFDGFNRIIQSRNEYEDPSSFSVKDFVYEDNGKIQKESLPYSATGSSYTNPTTNNNLYIKYTYDPLDRVKTIQNPVGTSTLSYDDWKVTAKDPELNTKKYSYDAYGNLIMATEYIDGNSYNTNYKYDLLGHLIKITDVYGNFYENFYDSLGRLIKVRPFAFSNDDALFYSYSYNDAGNLIEKSDPKSNVIKYGYDSLNRLVSEKNAGITKTTYEYDDCLNGKGRVCKVTTTNNTDEYSYNPIGGLSEMDRLIDGNSYLTKHEYDWQNNPLSITYPDDTKNTYTYNSAGKLKSIKHENEQIINNIVYAPTGNFEKIEFANGTSTTNSFDLNKLYRLTNKTTQKASNTIQNLSYLYDKVGNLTQIADSSDLKTKKTATFQYDDLYRLISTSVTNAFDNKNYQRQYQYNPIGNITYKSDQGNYYYQGNQAGSYAPPHAVTKVGNTNYEYDKNGDLLSNGNNNYSWDYNQRLTEVLYAGGATQYSYDQNNERTKKVEGEDVAIFINKLYEIRNGEPVKHIYANNELVASIDAKWTGGGSGGGNGGGMDVLVMEDAEDGDTLGWKAVSVGASVSNIYENAEQGNVIQLNQYGQLRLTNEDGSFWQNSTHKIFGWDMNFTGFFHLKLSLNTDKGLKYLIYSSYNYEQYSNNTYVFKHLGNNISDGQWNTMIKDIQADLESGLPGTTINEINYIDIIGAQGEKLDNIQFYKETSSADPQFDEWIVEDAEDGDTLGWSAVYYAVTVSNIYENEQQGNVIQLNNWGAYKITNEDGSNFANSTHKIISWDMNFNGYFTLKLSINTDQGVKYLSYNSFDNEAYSNNNYVNKHIKDDVFDGQWHTVVKDAQADLESYFPGIIINEINYIELWGSQNEKIDNIKFLEEIEEAVAPQYDEMIMEDAEDGDVLGWNALTAGVYMTNIYENEQQGNVIQLNEYGGFELKSEDGSYWDNSTHKIFSWDMSFENAIYLQLKLDTNKGIRYLSYSTNNYEKYNSEYFTYKQIEGEILDGQWHTIVKDLQADLSTVQPDTEIDEIDFIRIYWGDGGKVDNIKFLKEMDSDGGSDDTTTTPNTSTSTIVYHHTDHLSGTNIDTDEEGNVIEQVDYYPFGEIRIDETSPGYENNYKYNGKEFDEGVGLYYYGSRYYDPKIGRFISSDPWGGDLMDPQSLNKYSYVVNNPLKYVDPTGEFVVVAMLLSAEFIAATITATATITAAAVMLDNQPETPTILDNTPPPVEWEPIYTPADPHDPINILINPGYAESSSASDNIYTFPSYTPGISDNIYTTPRYTDTYQGVCGVNMSCAKGETPDTKEGEFIRLKNGQGWKEKKTGDVWRRSHTSHKGDKWKVFDGNKTKGGTKNTNKQSGGRKSVDEKGKVVGD